MSLGFSVSDIKLAIDCCKWVLDNFFDKNSSADKQYNDLENDVKLLDRRLRHLAQALEDALQHPHHSDLEAIDLKQDIKNLVGDFQHTINKAKVILLRYVNLQRNRSGIIERVNWAASGREKVEALRREIQIHSQKIYLVIDPVQLNLLTTIDEKVDEMRFMMERHFLVPTPLPILPRWLELRLGKVVYENPPQYFGYLSQIPMKEGFDALHCHFNESTIAFINPEIAPQTPEQYLNLLKCQWLLKTLRTGEQFRQAPTNSLYPRTLARMEQRIFKQYQRNDIIRFHENVLQNLNPAAFLIWPPKEMIEVKFPTDPVDTEELILRLSLPTSSGNGTDELLIFRVDSWTLRIVRKFMDRFGTPNFENDRFNIHHDKFIPFYTLVPDSSSRRRGKNRDISTSSISIHRANQTGAVDYEIRGEVDISRFQRAITGYQVWFSKAANWGINYSRKPPQGRGRVQIWHYKPLVGKTSSNPSSSPANSLRSSESQISLASDAIVRRLFRRRNTSGMSIIEQPETASTMVYAETPPHPVVMVFASQGNEHSYFYIELVFGIQIVPSSCECSRNPNACHRAVVERRDGGSSELNFLVRRMTIKTEKLRDWNIAVFGQPRHPMFANKKIVQRMETSKFLQLDFDSVEERKEFVKVFNKALEKRDIAERNLQKLLQDASLLGEKLGAPTKSKKLFKAQSQPRRYSTDSTIRETAHEPPFLQPISRLSTLTISESDADQIYELSGPDIEKDTPNTSPTSSTWSPGGSGEYYRPQYTRDSWR